MKKEVIQLDSLSLKIFQTIFILSLTIGSLALFIVILIQNSSKNFWGTFFELLPIFLILFIMGIFFGYLFFFYRKITIDYERKEIVYRQLFFKLVKIPFKSIVSITPEFKAKLSDFRWGLRRYIIPRIFIEKDDGWIIKLEGYMCLFDIWGNLKKEGNEKIVNRLNEIMQKNKTCF